MAGRHHKKRHTVGKSALIVGVVIISVSLFNSCRHNPSFSEIFGTGEAGQESSSTQPNAPDETSETPSSEEDQSSAVASDSQLDQWEEQLIDTPNSHTSDWNLVLVNRYHQLDSDMEFEPYYTENGMILDSRIAESFEAMMADGRAEGLQFILVSSYRSLSQQQANYDSVYYSYINQGYSVEEAVEKTEEYIALPNASEHSTGLAVDITEPVLYNNNEQGLVEEFDETPEGKWLQQNAAEYGFILRYPRGKEHLTIIEYESWHFRYVGVENARYIKNNHLTLEEYIEILNHNEEIRALMKDENG